MSAVKGMTGNAAENEYHIRDGGHEGLLVEKEEDSKLLGLIRRTVTESHQSTFGRTLYHKTCVWL